MAHFVRSTRATLVLLLAASLLSLTATAQEPGDRPQPALKQFATKGCIELGGTASFMWSQPVTGGKTSDATITFSLMPYGGYFIVDGFELGANPLGVTVEHRPAAGTESATTITSLSMFLAPSYNYRANPKVFPFIEGLAGYTADITAPNEGPRTTVDGFSWGGRLGLKLAVVERGLLIIGVQYLAITKNASGGSDRTGTNELSVSAGFSVWL